jgi:hypothetical protein
MTNEDLYVTNDFNICCVLKYFGCECEREFKQGKKKHWAFRRSKRSDEILERYWRRELNGNLPVFLDVQKFEKNSLYNQY